MRRSRTRRARWRRQARRSCTLSSSRTATTLPRPRLLPPPLRPPRPRRQPPLRGRSGGKVLATPATRAMARQHGLGLATVPAPAGRARHQGGRHQPHERWHSGRPAAAARAGCCCARACRRRARARGAADGDAQERAPHRGPRRADQGHPRGDVRADDGGARRAALWLQGRGAHGRADEGAAAAQAARAGGGAAQLHADAAARQGDLPRPRRLPDSQLADLARRDGADVQGGAQHRCRDGHADRPRRAQHQKRREPHPPLRAPRHSPRLEKAARSTPQTLNLRARARRHMLCPPVPRRTIRNAPAGSSHARCPRACVGLKCQRDASLAAQRACPLAHARVCAGRWTSKCLPRCPPPSPPRPINPLPSSPTPTLPPPTPPHPHTARPSHARTRPPRISSPTRLFRQCDGAGGDPDGKAAGRRQGRQAQGGGPQGGTFTLSNIGNVGGRELRHHRLQAWLAAARARARAHARARTPSRPVLQSALSRARTHVLPLAGTRAP